ncbi:MAG: hypothetical protein AAGE83_02335 [Pseudomonadota bacterium]
MSGATIISVVESPPAAWPTIAGAPEGVDPAVVWQRLETWVSYRWGERSVQLICEGCGELVPPLAPFTLDQAELWNEGDGWQVVSLPISPRGWRLDAFGPYRLSATVGSADAPPAAVAEAFRRLASYLAQGAGTGRTRSRIDEIETERPASWAARSLQYSGAADLLRPYRMAN